MSEWQRIIREESIASLEKLAEKFGHDVIEGRPRRFAQEIGDQKVAPA